MFQFGDRRQWLSTQLLEWRVSQLSGWSGEVCGRSLSVSLYIRQPVRGFRGLRQWEDSENYGKSGRLKVLFSKGCKKGCNNASWRRYIWISYKFDINLSSIYHWFVMILVLTSSNNDFAKEKGWYLLNKSIIPVSLKYDL